MHHFYGGPENQSGLNIIPLIATEQLNFIKAYFFLLTFQIF
jgi:hypothetical protein